jgi:hypothetical protein
MNFIARVQRTVRQYREAQQPWPATSKEIAAWAIAQKLMQPHPMAFLNQCANQIADALREEYFIDPQGRSVRAKHVAKAVRNGQTLPLWQDIRSGDRAHIEIALKQRRQQIVGDCKQLKSDADSFNQNYNLGKQIEMVFDFRRDLEESEGAANAA